MRRFTVSDIHGGYRALRQVLDLAKFDMWNDHLIVCGDVVDGWPQSRETVNCLLSLKHCIFVLGNHDDWFLQYMKTDNAPIVWTSQGGQATLDSYQLGVPSEHRKFFEDAPLYYVLDDMIFVHGGFNPEMNFRSQPRDAYLWDRSLIHDAWRGMKLGEPVNYGEWSTIFLGHTSLPNYNLYEPTRMGNVMALDTGGGWEWKLSLVDIDSGEYWQSDQVAKFYPNARGWW